MQSRGVIWYLILVKTTAAAFTIHSSLQTNHDPFYKYHRFQPKPPKQHEKKTFVLPSSSSSSLCETNDTIQTSSTVILLDVENVRGCCSFRISHQSLLSRVIQWLHYSSIDDVGEEGLIMVVDHGKEQTACQFHVPTMTEDSKHERKLGVLFGGDNNVSADDLIEIFIRCRCGGCSSDDDTTTNNGDGKKNVTVVITADLGLVNRCKRVWNHVRFQNGLSDNADELHFVESSTFLSLMQQFQDGDEGLRFHHHQPSQKHTTNTNHNHKNHERSTPNFHQTFSKQPEPSAVQRTLRARHHLMKSHETSLYISSHHQQQYRTGGGCGSKRNRIPSRKLIPTTKGRNSRLANKHRMEQRKLHLKYAFMERKRLAELFRLYLFKLLNHGKLEGVDVVGRLFNWIQSNHSEHKHNLSTFFTITQRHLNLHNQNRKGLLHSLLTASKINFNPKYAFSPNSDPFSSTILTLPLRKQQQQQQQQHNSSPKTLRLIVISDTHGYESTLSNFSTTTTTTTNDFSNYILPQADILIHCGDFTLSSSHSKQRQSIRQLDSFLHSQTHIKHKIVIRGNHDPDKGNLFPKSNAFYATRTKILSIMGLNFVLEPYSSSYSSTNQQPFNTNQPHCDVLVSHEPPHQILDTTYHGINAGSISLRQMVEQHWDIKPRLWLCGHIHEGRGVSIQRFNQHDHSITTMVVNAANANAGKACRLVAGPFLLDVDVDVDVDQHEDHDDHHLLDLFVDHSGKHFSAVQT